MRDTRVWYHVILTTYGAWLYGDSRGFRTRHHREHIEGDYRNPPPIELYARLESRNRESLAQPAVSLDAPWPPLVGEAIHIELSRLGAWLLVIAVVAQHVHMLAKMPVGRQRTWPGRAKRSATLFLHEHGWQGKLWGVRSKAIQIHDRSHQQNAYRYILAHAGQGAWIKERKKEPPRVDTDE